MNSGQVFGVICLLVGVLTLCKAQSSIAFENFCEEEGLDDNLSCEVSGGNVTCFAREELCNGSPFCMDESDEGMSQTGLDCDGSLTGRKPDNEGEQVPPSFLCSDGSSLMDIAKLCDGTADCPLGDDERSPLCANKCKAPYYGGCAHTRECVSTVEGATCGNCHPGYARDPRNYTIGECLEANFRLSRTGYSVCEGSQQTAYVYLQTSGVLDQAVVVTVRTVESGTATAGSDYVAATWELVFSPFAEGGARQYFTFRTISESATEGSETFLLEASAGDWPFTTGGNTSTVTITECSSTGVSPQYLVYISSSYAYGESIDQVTAYIVLASGVGTLEENVTVDVSTAAAPWWYGPSTGNVDFNETQATITFPNGTQGGARVPFSVPIIDDNIAEYNEYFIISSRVRGSGIGVFTRLSYDRYILIRDNDPFVVQLENNSYTVPEGGAVELCVVNATNVERVHQFSVSFYTYFDCESNNLFATSDLDYAGKYGRTQITFSPESYRECFTIQTYHDELNEADETFLVRSRSASGLGQLSPNPLIAEVLITNVQMVPVAVSIENPSYTIAPSEDSVEVCVIADSKLDQSVTINLHSSYESLSLNLSSNTRRSCVIFKFPPFTDDQSDIIEARLISDNRQVSISRSTAEVTILIRSVKDQCPQLADPTNGQVDILLIEGSILPGSVATYSCDIGFTPERERFRVCGNDLTWSGKPSTCMSEVDGTLSSSANEMILGFITSPYSTSQSVTVTTDSPSTVFYTITGDTFSVVPTVSSNHYASTGVPKNSGGKGFYLKAEEGKKVTVLGWLSVNSPTYSIDAFLAFATNPTMELNKYEYYSIPSKHSSSLLITARENETVVSFESTSMVLDQFQTYQINELPMLSSEQVTSNKLISVVSIKSCLDGVLYCDYLAEQVLPTHLWGKKFLVASFLGFKTGERIRVIFSKLFTRLTLTCTDRTFSQVTSQRPGYWVDLVLSRNGRDRFCVIEANDPIYVVQFSQDSDGESYMLTIPSVTQYGDRFVGFHTPNTSPFNFVTLYLTPEHYIPGLGVSVDGLPVHDWTAVQCSDGSTCGYIARPPLQRRNYHTVVHSDPRASIGVTSYGYDTGRNSSYGYPASLKISPPQNVDECLPDLDFCGSNALCIDQGGQYMCICAIGYERDEQALLCIDVNECEQDVCHAHAQCFNTEGSFNCTCNSGFVGTGLQCTPESSLRIYEDYLPFIDLGAPSPIELDDDDCKKVPSSNVGSFIPIGNTNAKDLWICDNGVISFGGPFKIWRPQLFPSANPFISRSNVLALFWNDHRPTGPGSMISYQTFSGRSTEIKNVNAFIRKQEGEPSFAGIWMIAISWKSIPLFSQRDTSIKGNTYQAIIISDITKTYSIFTYNDDEIAEYGTSNDDFSVVGYNFDQRAAGSLKIPPFQNHPFSRSSSIVQISKTNLEFSIPWANVIYVIGEGGTSGQQFAECSSKADQDIGLFEDRGIRLEQDLACPTFVNQAFRDRRYFHASGHLAAVTGDTRFYARNCFVQLFRPQRRNRGVNLCCYSTSEGFLGALLSDPSLEVDASTSLRYHPYFEQEEYVKFDYGFQESCCLQDQGDCMLYTDLRVKDFGIYKPSQFAWAWGDPHITTLDGLEYTFNGWGEYTLMEINIPDAHFLLQGRTHPVADSKATQYTGFAFGSLPNNSVEVLLNEDTGNFTVLLEGSDITANVSKSNDLLFSPNQDIFIARDTPNSLTCSFSLGISVTISLSSGMLSFVLQIPDPFQNMTRGLMGNNNEIKTDDLVYRNGTMLAHNVSDRNIHDFGQSWQITSEESLFTYPEGMSAENFTHHYHVPEFLDEVVSTATVEVLTACGDSVQCVFDASQTGDISIGLETMVTSEVNTENRLEATNSPPVITGSTTLSVILGQEAMFVFTVTDDNNLFNVSAIGGLPVNSTLTANPGNDSTEYTFRWTIFEIVDVSLMFEARDERSAVSVLSVQVQICACQNGGECTLNGLPSSSDRTVVLNCNCPEAYDGQFCVEDFDGCAEVICFNEDSCVDQPAPEVGVTCGPCPMGYFGDGIKCIDLNECEDGTHNCSDICVNNDGGFECDCSPGYTLINSTDCEDVDECTVLNGNCQQLCINLESGFSCSCEEGFELASDNRTCEALPEFSCDLDTNCTQICVRIFGVDTCSCNLGYQLEQDEVTCTDIDECEESPCDQMCINQEGGFNCSCQAGYALEADERTCQDIDECFIAAQNNSNLCTPPMFCSNTAGGFECLCPEGTEAAGGTCVLPRIQCPALHESEHSLANYLGSVPDPDYPIGTIAVSLCEQGYRMVEGDLLRTCSPNGTWTGEDTVCVALVAEGCSDIPDPTNGNIVFSNDTTSPFSTGTIATYKCDSGYILEGQAVRVCQDGDTADTWSGIAPICTAIVCPPVLIPNNGAVRYSTLPNGGGGYVFLTVATFSCLSGYGLVGSKTSICKENAISFNGSFSSAPPTCESIKCQPLNNLINGRMIYDTPPLLDGSLSYGTVVTHTCNPGHLLMGTNNRTCTGDGSSTTGYFDQEEASCQEITCPQLDIPENGQIDYSSNLNGPQYDLGVIATYSCASGLILENGYEQRLCQHNSLSNSGEWSGTEPQCLGTCPALTAPADGSIRYSKELRENNEYLSGTLATFSCDEGFEIFGEPTRICKNDTMWTNNQPFCQVACPGLVGIEFGTLIYSSDANVNGSYSVGTTVTYECDTNYRLIGMKSLVCESNMEWNGVTPVCERITCPDLPDPVNGNILFMSDDTAPFDLGTVATYKCYPGFALVGEYKVRNCLANQNLGIGFWNGTAPSCESVNCPSLPLPESVAQIDYSTTQNTSTMFPFGTEATYRCKEGYSPVSGDRQRRCEMIKGNVTGVWSGEEVVCEVIVGRCPDIANPKHGRVTFDHDSLAPFLPGTNATYSCDLGYGLEGGDEVRTCEMAGFSPDGVWSGVLPTCVAVVVCPQLEAPVNGSVTYSVDTEIEGIGFGAVASYSCHHPSLGVRGDRVRVCEPGSHGDGYRHGYQLVGMWSRWTPSCELIQCPDIADPFNGQILFATDRRAPFDYGTTAQYVCNSRFSLIGDESMRVCEGDGQSDVGVWSGYDYTCQFNDIP